VHAEDLSTGADAPIAAAVGIEPASFWSGVVFCAVVAGEDGTPIAESGTVRVGRRAPWSSAVGRLGEPRSDG
jgi:hypothetical protein